MNKKGCVEMKKIFIIFLVILMLTSGSACKNNNNNEVKNEQESNRDYADIEKNSNADADVEKHVIKDNVQVVNDNINKGGFTDGTYIVGQDILAGRYFIYPTTTHIDDNAQYEIFGNSHQQEEAQCACGGLIYENYVFNFDIITLDTGWVLYLDGVAAIPLSDYILKTPNITEIGKKSDHTYKEATYQVGSMIAPGIYRVIPEKGYSVYVISKDTYPLEDTTLEYAYPKDTIEISLSLGTYFSFSNCIVEKVSEENSDSAKKASQLLGIYRGTYQNNSGLMHMKVTMINITPGQVDPNALGYLEFWPDPSNTTGKSGMYDMMGYVDVHTGFIDMYGYEWMSKKPPNYSLLGFLGTITDSDLNGDFKRDYSTPFLLEKE
jgi:hypothetical protein